MMQSNHFKFFFLNQKLLTANEYAQHANVILHEYLDVYGYVHGYVHDLPNLKSGTSIQLQSEFQSAQSNSSTYLYS